MSTNESSISPEDFVQEFIDLKEQLVSEYFSSNSDVSRIEKLTEAGFSKEQIQLAKSILDEALTDALYNVLLGLEGAASISQHQVMYKLFDEKANELTGEIESIAWEKFHGKDT